MMRNLRLFTQRGFFADVLFLAGGTAVAQALVLLVSPLLTRLYSPEAFGALGVYTCILSVLSVVASLRYEQAIPLPEDEESADKLLALCLSIVLTLSLAVGVCVYWLGSSLESWSGFDGFRFYLWLLPLSLLGAGFYQALSYGATRRRDFAVIGFTRVAQAAGMLTVQAMGGLIKAGTHGLLAGFIASQTLGVSLLLRRSRLTANAFCPRKWKDLGSRYRKFPLITAWDGLLAVLSASAPCVVLAGLFDLKTAGQFSLTMRVLSLPSALIGQALSQVLLPLLATRRVNDLTQRLIERCATSLAVMAYLICTLLALHGPLLFSFFFGPHWSKAGCFARYQTITLFFSLITSPLGVITIVTEKMLAGLIFNLALLALRLAMLSVGAWYGSADLAIVLFSVAGGAVYVVYLGFVLRLVGSSLISWLSLNRDLLLLLLTTFIALCAAKNTLRPGVALVTSALGLSIVGAWFCLRTSPRELNF